MKQSSWDLDYRDGRAGEQLVHGLLTGGQTVEVKTDRRWSETGNLYIETECFYQASQSWELSGLNVSAADYWAFVLEDTVLMVTKANLMKTVAEYGRPITCKIEPNPSRGYLITAENILQTTKKNPLP